MHIKTREAAILSLFIGATSIWCMEKISAGKSERSTKRGFPGYGLLFLLLCAGAVPIAKADPIGVAYTASLVGGTEWQYSYHLSGAFPAGDDIAIFFPVPTSSNLVTSGSSTPDWSTLVFQPDPLLPADGEFDIIANIGNPNLAPAFDLSFQYSGPGVPGSQFFTVFDSNFNVIDTGSTTPAASTIPEPSPFLLLGSGLVGLLGRVTRKP
jgi:PEP-CTERM motif-containing protein